MRLKVLIAPDKFKGTLSAHAAAEAIARGWRKARPDDVLELLPISDGGDGFGEVISQLVGARQLKCKTVDAAHRPCSATWWWDAKTKTAIIESAKVIGLAMLPPGKFHPFDLDTFGLGAVLCAARAKGAKQILIGIGGSATNDGGFGLARAMGWEFFDRHGGKIERWIELEKLVEIRPPSLKISCQVIVAVDVQNQLLGVRGATRIYGPQKGLRSQDFELAERCLRRLAQICSGGLRSSHGQRRSQGAATVAGSGAAGGLGFGLRAFLGAKFELGFELFARRAKLSQRLRKTDLVITGEGAIDRSTLMGKGVGQIARRCLKLKIPCVGFGGAVGKSAGLKKTFTLVSALTELAPVAEAKTNAALWLSRLAERIALDWPASK
jgi:glycerate kinase